MSPKRPLLAWRLRFWGHLVGPYGCSGGCECVGSSTMDQSGPSARVSVCTGWSFETRERGVGATQLYALPAYADKAAKVGIEMKALRLRMDRAKQRAMALQKKREESEFH